MRRNSLVRYGLLISDTPHLRWTTRSLAFGQLFSVYPPLSFEIPQNRAQHAAFQVAAEEVVDLGAGHPLFACFPECFEDFVAHHVTGPIPEDQVGGLLSVLPDGQGSQEVIDPDHCGKVQGSIDGRDAPHLGFGALYHGPKEPWLAFGEVRVDLFPQLHGAVAVEFFDLFGEVDAPRRLPELKRSF